MAMADNSTQERLNRIEELANSGLKHAAAQLARLVLENDVNNFEALIWLARTSNQPEEVNKALDRATQLRPNDPAVRELLYNGGSAAQAEVVPNIFAGQPTNFSSSPIYNPSQPSSFTNFNTEINPPPTPATSSAYDYLKNLNSNTATINPVAPPPPPLVAEPGKAKSERKAPKTKTGLNRVGLVFGLLLFLGGLVAAAWWGISVANFNGDATNQLQAQVTTLSITDGKPELVAQVKGLSGNRSYAVSKQLFETLTPLISNRTGNALVENAVILNVNGVGRLKSVEVLSPNKGTAENSNLSLLNLGLAPDFDWILVGLQAVVALIGLLLIAFSVNRKTT